MTTRNNTNSKAPSPATAGEGGGGGMTRRSFLKRLGLGTVAVAGVGVANCKNGNSSAGSAPKGEPTGKMTYRTNQNSGDQVSILGYGCMRWPSTRNGRRETIDQEAVNRLVDYAIEHGVNYFDTAPVYGGGKSESVTGIALKRHPREKFFIATKLSNFSRNDFSRERSIAMYQNSMKELQVDYIDYYLLHSIGGGGLRQFDERFVDNGMIEFLKEEHKAGRIRNLGFSFHGDKAVFDHALQMHDAGEVHWDFVQIQMNYVDWKYGNDGTAKYLYEELEKRDIPVVIMEPLLGGRLSSLPDHIVSRLKQRAPERSVASWAFRYAGTQPRVLTVLSGMTYMEHLQDNVGTYSPLKALTGEEMQFLYDTADLIKQYPTIPCNDCKYCMPCPYGLDIPAIFGHYNKCINEDNVAVSAQDANYKRARKAFLVGYDRAVPKERQASQCVACGQCSPQCPQRIDIPHEMERIDHYVEDLRQNRLSLSEAKKLLGQGNCSLVVVPTQGTAARYNQRGVNDLLNLLDNNPKHLADASVADKIIGKAAAALMILGKVREVYTPLITTDARKLFINHGVRVEYDDEIPFIENRDKTGRCPIDTACADLTKPKDIVAAVRKFVASQKDN